MIQLRSDEELRVVQELLQEKVPKPTVEIANTGTAAGLNDQLVLGFRGHLYRVPPIPYKIGIQLERLRLGLEKEAELGEETDGAMDRLEALFKQAVPLFKEAVTPVAPFRRIFWKHRKNPFLLASPTDIAAMLHFFSLCRTRSAVRLQVDYNFLGKQLPG